MSDQKKPAATFGDVMLGIPAGGRDKAEGSRDEKRGDRPHQGGPQGQRPPRNFEPRGRREKPLDPNSPFAVLAKLKG